MRLGVSIKFDRQVMRKNDRPSVIGKEVSRMPNRFGSTFQSKGSITSFGSNPFEAEKSKSTNLSAPEKIDRLYLG